MARSKLIIGLGEILWDVFPDGVRFGGAPANFACSAAALTGGSMRVGMASQVGQDDQGQRAIDALAEKRVDPEGVLRSSQPTGQVFVQIDAGGQASYEFAADTAWDNFIWSETWEALALQTNACCFGSLAQRSDVSRRAIQRFVSTTPESALRVFDVNLRAPFFSDAIILESLQLANVLKLNDEELPVLASLCKFTGTHVDVMKQLAERFQLGCVALTRGARGAVVWGRESVSEASAIATEVVDTVGAGDAFTASLVVGLLDGRDLDTINHRACEVAAFVCSEPGATPNFPDTLTHR